MKISIVIPVYNEERNLPPFFGVLKRAVGDLEYEVIAIDDGSRDKSLDVLRAHATEDKRIKVISFRGNFGQTAALSAGIAHSSGEIIVPIDSDLENDPRDIPKLLAKLEEGYDVVSGWRQDRWKGHWLTRKLPSLVANWLISRITHVPLHDYGCTLKAYRREVIVDVPLYGEMHRFIPAFAFWRGAHVTELPVRFTPRAFGRSNYGFSRTFKVLLDLLVIRFLDRYMTKPMHFFGGVGFISIALGFLAGVWAIGLKFFSGLGLTHTPLPILATFFFMIGVQLIVMGILAEMLMRIYFESRGEPPYSVRERINYE